MPGRMPGRRLVSASLREAREEDCVYYLRESLHKLSTEVSHLADDMAAGDRDGRETLLLLKQYIQKISDDMAKLDEEKR